MAGVNGKTTIRLFTTSSKKQNEKVNAVAGDSQVLAIGQLWIQDLCSSSFDADVGLGCNLLCLWSSRNLYLVFELCGERLELQTVALLCKSSVFSVQLPVIAWDVISEIWLALAAHRAGRAWELCKTPCCLAFLTFPEDGGFLSGWFLSGSSQQLHAQLLFQSRDS